VKNRALVQFMRNPAARMGTHPKSSFHHYVMIPARLERDVVVFLEALFKENWDGIRTPKSRGHDAIPPQVMPL